MSNWIVTAFQELKAKVESHIPASEARLDAVEQRVQGVETYTQASVDDLQKRMAALERGHS